MSSLAWAIFHIYIDETGPGFCKRVSFRLNLGFFGSLIAHVAFGHSEYKGKQKEIVEAAIQGCDVFVLAPTGMGKSICFQVPAMADKVRISINPM